MTSKDVLQCLADRFCAPEWAFTTELSLVPGMIRGRRADAVAMNCGNTEPWGQAVLGFEVKVSRSDFKAELKEPLKRVETYHGCDVLFLAIPKGLVKPEEVPDDMGIIECWTKVVPATQYSKESTATFTRIKRQPPGMDKLPVPAAMTWKTSGPGSYRYKVLELDKIKPMERTTAVAIIRAFDPDRQAIDDHNTTIRLEHEAREKNYKIDRLRRGLRQALLDTSMP